MSRVGVERTVAASPNRVEAIEMARAVTSFGDPVLLVEDNPGDALIVRMALAGAREPLEVEHVTRLEDANELLRERKFRAIILDLGLPDSRGPETISRLDEAASDVPVVVLTGQAEARTREASLARGAAGFFDKGELEGRELVALLESLIADAPRPPQESSAEQWMDFVNQSTARLGARLHHAAAWLESADTHLRRLAELNRGPQGGAEQPSDAWLGSCREVAEEARRAVDASRVEVRDMLALTTRVQRSLPRSTVVTTGTLRTSLERAAQVVGSELSPAFRVEAAAHVLPDMPVDGGALLGLIRRTTAAIRATVTGELEPAARLKLTSHVSSEEVVVAIDAELPAVDQAELRRRLDLICGGPIVPGEHELARPRLRSARGMPDQTLLCLEIPIARAVELDGSDAASRTVLEQWWDVFDSLGRAMRRANDSGIGALTDAYGALHRLERLWPGYLEARVSLLDEVEERAPWLRVAVNEARTGSAAFRMRLHGLGAQLEQLLRSSDLSCASDQRAVDRIEREIETWRDDLVADDERLARLLVDSVWRDVGTVD